VTLQGFFPYSLDDTPLGVCIFGCFKSLDASFSDVKYLESIRDTGSFKRPEPGRLQKILGGAMATVEGLGVVENEDEDEGEEEEKGVEGKKDDNHQEMKAADKNTMGKNIKKKNSVDLTGGVKDFDGLLQSASSKESATAYEVFEINDDIINETFERIQSSIKRKLAWNLIGMDYSLS
jgi:hypothetical protein